MKKVNICIVGLGLIGGSFGLSFRKLPYIQKIIGVDHSDEHAKEALRLGLIDEIRPLKEAIQEADVVLVATPVNVIVNQLTDILDQVDQQVVFDVGSTKKNIIDSVKDHRNKKRFVPCHPMAGTEFSGPSAAKEHLYQDKYNVICNPDQCDEDALIMVERILTDIGMHLMYQDAAEHDVQVAYVSHISHISAFALALTVLHKEKSEERIFQLASGGFRSSVRLAKSNPRTWAPIFEQNRDAVMDVLDEHITVLSKFRSLLIKKDFEQFSDLMTEANEIKRILNKKNHNQEHNEYTRII